MTTQTKAPPQDLVGWLDYYLVQKAPVQLPDQAKEWIVRYGPVITVVLLLIALPTLLFALGTLVEMLLMTAALPGLFQRRMAGWRLMFYSSLVGLAVSLLHGAIVGGLVGALVSLYVLFQVRLLYKE